MDGNEPKGILVHPANTILPSESFSEEKNGTSLIGKMLIIFLNTEEEMNFLSLFKWKEIKYKRFNSKYMYIYLLFILEKKKKSNRLEKNKNKIKNNCFFYSIPFSLQFTYFISFHIYSVYKHP